MLTENVQVVTAAPPLVVPVARAVVGAGLAVVGVVCAVALWRWLAAPEDA